jgi:hypothetical protein
MLFMVVEHFPAGGDPVPVYRRLRDAGRGLPEGVDYVDSWIEVGFGRCFQLMRADDAALLQQWVLHWRGLGIRMEIVPVVPSAQVRAMVEPLLEGGAGP